ncbi:hypothetical protein GGF46_002710 [Coemansia sp. RSA 552]|nr:hypothetical protein GGF46_002710 [Coemansia sp. RSA 552]
MTVTLPEATELRYSVSNNVSCLYQFYCSYIILYRNAGGEKEFLPAELLAESLKVLVRKYYRPVAGWFERRGSCDVDVVCRSDRFNDPPFTTQTLDMEYKTAEGHVHGSNIELFVPQGPEGTITDDDPNMPMFLAKATYLESNEGVVLGVNYHHSLMDGSSFWMFMNNWSSLCGQLRAQPNRTEFDLPYPPEFGFPEISHLRDPSRSFKHHEYVLVDAGECSKVFQPGPDTIAENVFTITTEQQLEIRRLAKAHGTSFTEMLCAIFWKGLSEVRLQARPELSEGTSLFTCAVNPRKRLGISANLCGSPVINTSGAETVAEIARLDLVDVAQIVRQVIGKGNGAYLSSSFDFLLGHWQKEMAAEALGQTVDKKIMLVYVRPQSVKCTVSSSPTFPIYQTDFGFGPPAYVRPPFLPFDGCLRIWPTPQYTCGETTAPLEVYLSHPECLDLTTSPLLRQFGRRTGFGPISG